MIPSEEIFKILVVDDDSPHREIFKRWLNDSGYECHGLENGQKSLDYLQEGHKIDLVITDMMMPGIDGMQLLRRIKRENDEINLLVVTGHSKEYPLEEIVEAGADDFIEKPTSKNVLLSKVKRIIKIQRLKNALHAELNTQKFLVELLNLSIENKIIDDFLQEFISCIVTFPWLDLEPKGAVFLVDESDRRLLLLKAHYNLADPLQSTCARVPFGQCLCGRAAVSRDVIFVNTVDKSHDNTYEAMPNHGHYCVPIISAKNTLLGVFTLYTKPDVQRNEMVEKVLRAAAKTLARIITARKDEALIRQHEQRFKSITENALDAIIMMNERGRISSWNPAAERIFGYRSADVLGKDLHDIVASKHYQEQYRPALADFFKSGGGNAIGQTIEVSGRHKNGTEFPLELSLSSFHTVDGWQSIGLVRDITSRKAMEKEKEKLAEQLRLAKKMEAVGTLAGGIAHDFNNILGAIIGSADIALNEVEPGSLISKDLKRILTAGNRAKDLVAKMLIFSRQRRRELKPVALREIVEKSLKILAPKIPANILVSKVIEGHNDLVQVDPEQIQQVIINLCRNSLRAMGDNGGTLSLKITEIMHEPSINEDLRNLKEGRYIRMSVADTGYGIEEEMLDRIFEPFFSTKERGAKTGMGMDLALVHSIVTDHNGEVVVESVPGRGSLFAVYLPAVQGDGKTALPCGRN